jgi:2-amino-4-hydroxy-6-hydroxymethyldihydropteridine diphosphokinase
VRPDAVRWGPRDIDIDILWWSRGSFIREGLVVPHARLSERAFALVPLLEVLPEASDPMTEQPYSMLSIARATLDDMGAL